MDAIVARYLAGESGMELAKAFGLKKCRVYKLLRERTLSDGSSVVRSKSEAATLEQARRLAEGKLEKHPAVDVETWTP